jgi:hypothetical protein
MILIPIFIKSRKKEQNIILFMVFTRYQLFPEITPV